MKYLYSNIFLKSVDKIQDSLKTAKNNVYFRVTTMLIFIRSYSYLVKKLFKKRSHQGFPTGFW
jgi:hypothetical protein